MSRFNLDNYEEVKDRLPRFYEQYPDGRVNTEIHSLTEDFKTVVIMAYLYKDAEEQAAKLPLSTGIAWEVQGQGMVNRTSHVENCETSAIGRALANIGFHGSQRPSREEMEKVQRMSEPAQRSAPRVTNKPATTPNSRTDSGEESPARLARMKGIYSAANAKGISRGEDVKALASAFSGSQITSLKDLDDDALASLHQSILRSSEGDLQDMVMASKKKGA